MSENVSYQGIAQELFPGETFTDDEARLVVKAYAKGYREGVASTESIVATESLQRIRGSTRASKQAKLTGTHKGEA